VALSGVAGVAMLIAHFQIPAHVPGDNSPPATMTQYVLQPHAAILATAWLQGFGPFPYVLFALGVVYLAGAMTRLAGWVTVLASAVIFTLSLIDAATSLADALAGAPAVDDALQRWREAQLQFATQLLPIAERTERRQVFDMPDLATMPPAAANDWMSAAHPGYVVTLPAAGSATS
jgi:hypothetical protein